MSTDTFVRRLECGVDADELFRWHARPGAFERLLPPWENVRLTSPPAELREGAQQEVAVRYGPLERRWLSRITRVEPGSGFADEQVRGPFARWRHEHSMRGDGGGSVLEDRVDFALPGWGLGDLVAGGFVRRRLERAFAYRHRVTAGDLARHAGTKAARPLTVVVSGASGLVGKALCSFLTTGGHTVRRLVRRDALLEDEYRWDPARGEVHPRALEGADAVVHLAGENIASGRWTRARKERILASRVEGTRVLVDAANKAREAPRTFVSASAIGFYGDRGDELLDERSGSGTGFLAEVCRAWEAELERLDGARAVAMRFGVVLSGAGGALAKMLPPFLAGGGGRIGSGRQWMSWVALDDVVGALHHALLTEALSGPVNTVAPNPATNAEFTRTLGRVLRRPTIFPMPAVAARLAFGELADELLIAGQRVEPKRLVETGYRFAFPTLEGALRHQLGRTVAAPAPEPVGAGR